MARRKKAIPQYGTVMLNGIEYYRTRIEDADGKRVALYAKTAEELFEKVEEAKRQIEETIFRRSTPTVAEYCEKWLVIQSGRIRSTTLVDYTSKVKNYIVKPLGDKYMADVTADDIKLALVPVAEKSSSVYKSVNIPFGRSFSFQFAPQLVVSEEDRKLTPSANFLNYVCNDKKSRYTAHQISGR